jgi:hypothetical protein
MPTESDDQRISGLQATGAQVRPQNVFALKVSVPGDVYFVLPRENTVS